MGHNPVSLPHNAANAYTAGGPLPQPKRPYLDEDHANNNAPIQTTKRAKGSIYYKKSPCCYDNWNCTKRGPTDGKWGKKKFEEHYRNDHVPGLKDEEGVAHCKFRNCEVTDSGDGTTLAKHNWDDHIHPPQSNTTGSPSASNLGLEYED
jgi:hypothetical protein